MAAVLELVQEQNRATDPFDDFWLLYPRRVAKKDARKAWSRIPPSQHVAILTAVVAWRRVWADKDAQYIPHPATWLNGERWEDELPATNVPLHASHVAATRQELPQERGVIPANVQAVLNKLRGKP